MTRPDLRSERGFTMIAVMIVMTVATVVATGTLLAAQHDLPFSKASSDRKQAYAAAEAGVEFYLHQLKNDNEYWTKCTNVPAPAPINQKGANPRKWRTLSGTTAEYTIELLPANGATSCVEGQADKTLLDQSTGTIRIRSTGKAGDATRSIVGEFRRAGFLDFLYFTDFETTSPEGYPDASDRAFAASYCADRYREDRDSRCQDIQFISDDKNLGPFHTNDDILACGGYTLGRSDADKIEIVKGSPKGWTHPGVGGPCNAGEPNVKGTLDHPATYLPMPTTNAAVRDKAAPAYTYKGRTWIQLRDNQMDVTTWTSSTNKSTQTLALPPNGVIAVKTDTSIGCTGTQPPVRQAYNEGRGCANVTVWGSYSKSLTIASEKDIVVGTPVDPATNTPQQSSANLTRNGDVVLGLIADKFVRVSHAVARQSDGHCSGNRSPTMKTIKIDAAILSLNHSFMADNHECGAELIDSSGNSLTVTGAIAQKYRGPVGTTGGTGFTKNYVYDDRLRYRSPPYFLTPIQSAWNISRENEQVPAAAQD